jgi:hypothetical protein
VKHLTYSAVLLTILAPSFACRVDNGGLGNEMPVLRHDSGANVDVPITGAAGDTGAAGVIGAAGNTAGGGSGGDSNQSGAAGDGTAGTGSAGLGGAGTAGDMGAAGNLGSAGTTGSAGNTGAAGVTGTAGTTGAAGSGAAGVMGTAGTTGTAGVTGTAGTTGAAGSPPPTCGPKTCPTGCCDGTRCVAGRSLERCGNGGGACSTCAKCLLCTNAGACDVDPNSTWNVVCGQATIATSPPGGGTWDPHIGSNGTAPDPFCEFEMPAGSLANAANTIAQPDTFSPVWNTDITPGGKPIKAMDLMSPSKSWRLWIGDDDGCTVRGGCIGQELCEIHQPLAAGALISGQIVEKNLASCLSLTVKFVCQP